MNKDEFDTHRKYGRSLYGDPCGDQRAATSIVRLCNEVERLYLALRDASAAISPGWSEWMEEVLTLPDEVAVPTVVAPLVVPQDGKPSSGYQITGVIVDRPTAESLGLADQWDKGNGPT